MSNGRVLVTGRYGFTGRYVADALSAVGWQVWGASTHPTKETGAYDRFADLTDADSVSKLIDDVKPDAVVHLAGMAFVAHGETNDFYQVNLIGTRNLLDALARGGYGHKGVLLASSANIYGNAGSKFISENTLPDPANDYAVSKLAMEYMANLYHPKLPIIITRPFNYTGIGQDIKYLVPKIVSHFQKRKPYIELGNLDIERDLSDVRDVAHLYSALLECVDAPGKVFNICSGHSISLKEIVALCREITGHNIELIVNPAFVRYDEIKVLVGDASRLESLIGSPPRRPFKQTLEWMLNGHVG